MAGGTQSLKRELHALPNDQSKRKKKTFLLCETQIETDMNKSEQFKLTFPESRKDKSTPFTENHSSFSESWQSRVQTEYNDCPVGPYAGPYDQASCLPLSVQLPGSDLDFDKYTKFQHDESADCMKYQVSCIYDAFDDLEKIKVLGPVEVVKNPVEVNNDYKRKITYTCVKSRCEIPCPCKDCCQQKGQCTEHKIGHPSDFDAEAHLISIRASDLEWKDSSFFSNSYVNKYSQLPKPCKSCHRDLVHHNAYHIDYHFYCKFCVQNHYKLKAASKKELIQEIKSEKDYYETVCNYCNKKFQDKDTCKKHKRYTHEKVPYRCDLCEAEYTSEAAKEYHVKTVHEKDCSFVCDLCDKSFKAEVLLKEHKKYVHSSVKKFSCEDCDAKFKRNQDLQWHMRNVHNFYQKMEDYGEEKERLIFMCEECDASYAYKKSLNDHINRKHSGSSQEFKCEKCEKSFNQKKNLNRHMKTHE